MDTPEVRDTRQLFGTFAAFRNNKFTRQFVREWLELCENPHALTDSPSSDEHPDFLVHRHDQAIFSLLSIKYKDHFTKLNMEEVGRYFYHHRRRTITPDFKLLSHYPIETDDLNLWDQLFVWLLKKYKP